jgi:hypothetical protein
VGVHRTVVSKDSVPGDQTADFACAYEVPIADGDTRSTEEWARDAWEGSPAPLRWLMLAGWRFVLGLRLGPRSSSDYILGWRITDRRSDQTICRLESPFLHAVNMFERVDGQLKWSTYVVYDRAVAKVIWPPVSLLHRPLVRIALGRAARRGSRLPP